MLTRRLGRTGLEVSALGFGLMRLPLAEPGASRMDPNAPVDVDLTLRMIETAERHGVNYFDTAWPYHGGQSEEILGRALAGGLRNRVFVATKLPVFLVRAPQDCERFLDEQLRRLRTDHLDVYLLHSLKASAWQTVRENKVLEFLDRAVADGRVGAVGFSFHDELPLFKEIVDAFPWAAAQIQLNYFDVSYQAGLEGAKHAAAKGMGVIAMEPLRGGKLAERLPTDVETLFRNHEPRRTGASWALRWVWDRPEVSTVLSGMSSMEQLRENLATAEDDARPESLSRGERELIDRAAELFRQRAKIDCTACGYCLPCPSGVGIPQVFGIYNDIFMFDDPVGPAVNYNMYFPPEHRAEKCEECGECLPKCPQGIDIPERLKEARAALALPKR